MNKMKKLLGVILSLSLVLGMVMPSMNTKAEGTEGFDFNTIAGISVSFEGELLEGDVVDLSEPSSGGNGPVNFTGYNIHNLTPIVTVSYNDGTPADVYNGWNAVYVDMSNKYGTQMMFRTNQATTPWKVGQNEVEVSFGNDVYKANATVKENPVTSISVTATKTIYEGNVNQYSKWDEQTQQDVWYDAYDIYSTSPEVTVTKKDGTTSTYQRWELQNVFGEDVELSSDQSSTNKWGVGKHTASARFMGRTCDFEVEIVENPVASISVVATVDMYEGDVVQEQYWDEQTQQLGWYDVYDIGSASPEVTVTFKNGISETYQTWELYEEFGMSPEYITDQTPTNKWGLGKHTVTVSFMEQTCDFEVEIVEHPIKSIAGKYHGAIVEDTEVAIDHSKVEYIFTFANGSVESFYQYEEVLGEQISPYLEPLDLSNSGTWDTGKHYLVGEIWGKEVKVEVDVQSKADAPIKEISAVATKDLVADWHWGSYGPGTPKFLQPTYCDPKVTVTYQDGTQETIWYSALQTKFDGVEPKLTLDNDSLEGTGKRPVTLEFYGQTCKFEVNVIENPVESISAVTTKSLIEGWRGRYSIVLDGGLIITVNYTDGTKISGTVDELNSKLNAYPQDYIEENAGVGKNIAKLEFLNRTCDVEFEVIEDPNPVVGLDAKVKEGAVLYEKESAATNTRYNYEHLIDVTLSFKDGSKISGTVDEVNQQLDNINIKQIFAFDTQSMTPWRLGKHLVTVSYDDFEENVEIEVIANPYSKATISNDGGLTIVLQKVSGEKETYKATHFSPSGSYGNSYNMLGYIETDKGTLPVEVKFAGGRDSDYCNIIYMVINGVRSNSLQDCEWMEQQMIVEMNGVVPQTVVNNSAAELKEMVLTEDDYKFGNIDSVKAWLVISENNDISAEEQALLDKAKNGQLENYKDGVVVDLTLYKQYSDMRTQKTITEKVPEPNGKVSITMAVPEEILASGTNPENIKMVRIHNGETTVLPCTYDKETQTITFETDAFSTYSMVYEVASTGAGSTTGKPSPNTGDNNFVVGYMTLCVAALAVIATKKRRDSLAK